MESSATDETPMEPRATGSDAGTRSSPTRSDRRQCRKDTDPTLTRRSLVAATGTGIAGTVLGGLGTVSAVGGSTSRLQTDGRWIVTENGDPFVMRGFATAGLDFYDHDWHPVDQSDVLSRATDGDVWHPNTVRLPITE